MKFNLWNFKENYPIITHDIRGMTCLTGIFNTKNPHFDNINTQLHCTGFHVLLHMSKRASMYNLPCSYIKMPWLPSCCPWRKIKCLQNVLASSGCTIYNIGCYCWQRNQKFKMNMCIRKPHIL